MSIKIWAHDANTDTKRCLFERERGTPLCDVWDKKYGMYAYKCCTETGVPLKPVHRLEKKLKYSVIFSDKPGLCEFQKSRPVGGFKLCNYINDKMQPTEASTVVVEGCVADKIDKI